MGRLTLGQTLTLSFVAMLASAPAAAAQLRPLSPVDWEAFDGAKTVHAGIGAGLFGGQRAALAGTDGRLLELGNYRAAIRSGRIVLEISGTAVRHFHDREVLEPPVEDTRPPNDGPRLDTGDHRIATLLLLTSPDSPVDALLRFGTRLPTTDNAIGLDRDRTDFFATVAARAVRGPWSLAAEAGLGIHGSRSAGFDQADVLVYSAELKYGTAGMVPVVTVVGHDGLTSRRIRGNEDLGEIRAGLQLGSGRWLRFEAVAGIADAGPDTGVLISAGWRR